MTKKNADDTDFKMIKNDLLTILKICDNQLYLRNLPSLIF